MIPIKPHKSMVSEDTYWTPNLLMFFLQAVHKYKALPKLGWFMFM